jgi:hypothetical protein
MSAPLDQKEAIKKENNINNNIFMTISNKRQWVTTCQLTDTGTDLAGIGGTKSANWQAWN